MTSFFQSQINIKIKSAKAETFKQNAWYRELNHKTVNIIYKPKHNIYLNFFNLINQLNLSCQQKNRFAVYYYDPFFENFLKVLKNKGVIYSYGKFNVREVLNHIKLEHTVKFKHSMLIYVLLQAKRAPFKIKIVHYRSGFTSCPIHQIYWFEKFNQGGSFTVVSTTKGLMTGAEAVKKKIGGVLLCRVF